MGYRSYGAICIEGPEKDMTVLLAKTRMLGETAKPIFGEDGSRVTIKTKDGITRWELEFDNWKWYHSYPDIIAFENFWDEASMNDNLQGFRWRQGEEDMDLETHEFGGSIEGAYVRRGLAITFGDIDYAVNTGSDFIIVVAGPEYMDEHGEAASNMDSYFEEINAAFTGAGFTTRESFDDNGPAKYILVEKKGPTSSEVEQMTKIYEGLMEKFQSTPMKLGLAKIINNELEMYGITWFDSATAEIRAQNFAGYASW